MSRFNVIDDTIDFDRYLALKEEAPKIRTLAGYRDQIVDRFHGDLREAGSIMPWRKTQDKILVRPGKVSIWTGYQFHGKTNVLKNCLNFFMAQGDRVCGAFMEETPDETGYDLIQQAAHNDNPAIKFIDYYIDWAANKLWLYAQKGRVDPRRLLAVMNYAHQMLGINHFVIDSLMKTTIPKDDYVRQAEFINDLCIYAEATGVHVHIVCHAKKGKTQTVKADVFDVAGGLELIAQADNIFNVWRNTQKEDYPEDHEDEADTILTVEKQRGRVDWRGEVQLWHHKGSRQFVESPKAHPIDFFQWPPAEAA